MKRIVLGVVAGVASFMLAKCSWTLSFATPGMLVARLFIPPSPSASLLAVLCIQMTVDFSLWFAVMWAAYHLFGTLWRKSRGQE